MATLTIVSTIATLQTTAGSTSINVFVTDPNQGGYFYYSSTNPYSFESTPDLGIVFSANGSGFWVRKIDEAGAINVKWFGAMGNQTTDDTTAITNAAAFVTSLAAASVTQSTPITLFFPANHTYQVKNTTITIGPNVSVRMESAIYFVDSTNSLPCLVIGNNTVSANDGPNFSIKVLKPVQSDWSNESCIGVQFINPTNSIINVQAASGFTIGVQFNAKNTSTAGGEIAYNTVYLGDITNNKVGVDITTTGAGSFANDNLFFNGNIGSSNPSGASRYGIRFNPLGGYDNNNNKFYKPVFQLNNSEVTTPNVSIPVLFNCGVSNSTFDARCEGSGKVFVQVKGTTCAINFFEAGYSDQSSTNLYDYFSDTSNFFSTEVKISALPFQQYPSLVFESGYLPSLANLYDNVNYYIPGLSFASSADGDIHISAPLTSVHQDYIETNNTHGISILINTETAKRFVIKKNVIPALPSNGGRIVFVAYSSPTTILNPTTNPYIIAVANTAIYAIATQWGGGYVTNVDSDSDITFAINPAYTVYQVKVIFTGGTNTLKLRDFAIYALDAKSAQGFAGLEPLNLNSLLVNAQPSYIAPKGTKVYNDFSSSTNIIGWANIDGNTAWSPFGLVNLPNLLQTASIKTTNATPATIYTYAISINTVNQFTVDINGSDISGDVVSQKFFVRVKRGSTGAPTIIGTSTALVTAYADTALSACTVAASISGNNLIITVTGVASIPIQWGAVVMILSTQDVGS